MVGTPTQQLALTGSAGLRPAIMGVVDDYGPVGEGVSGARYVLAENLQEYLIKGTAFARGNPYVAVNEWVAASLGRALGLPVLDWTVVQLGGNACFASAYMAKNSFDAKLTEANLAQCENRDRIYDVVAFDAWIGNVDRHR